MFFYRIMFGSDNNIDIQFSLIPYSRALPGNCEPKPSHTDLAELSPGMVYLVVEQKQRTARQVREKRGETEEKKEFRSSDHLVATRLRLPGEAQLLGEAWEPWTSWLYKGSREGCCEKEVCSDQDDCLHLLMALVDLDLVPWNANWNSDPCV